MEQLCGAEVEKQMIEDVKIMVANCVEDKYVADPGDKHQGDYLVENHRNGDDEWELLKDIRQENPGDDSQPDVKVESTDVHEETTRENVEKKPPSATAKPVEFIDVKESRQEQQQEDSNIPESSDSPETATDGGRCSGRFSESSEAVPVPHSGLIPLSGPLHRSSYSGAVPYSGNLSLRSDSSTTSTRSFAFPVLTFEWNSSPAKMAPPDKRYMRRKGWFWRCCCCCCDSSSTSYH